MSLCTMIYMSIGLMYLTYPTERKHVTDQPCTLAINSEVKCITEMQELGCGCIIISFLGLLLFASSVVLKANLASASWTENGHAVA